MIKKTKKVEAKNHHVNKAPAKSSLWYNQHNRLWMLLVVLVFAVAGYFLLFSHAATPTAPNVYLSTTTTSIGANGTFTVQIRENSGATAVNSVEADFSYPTALLSYVSMSTAGTAFGSVAQQTGGSGTVTFAGGVTPINNTPTTVTGDQLLATVTFKSLAAGGTASMAFTSGTILVSSSTNQDILGSLSNTTGASVIVDVTAPTATASSPANGASVGGGGTVTLTATATDTQTAIASVSFYIDGSLVGTDTATPYTFAWNTGSVALGSHTFQAKATDAVGNVGSSATNTFTLTDATPPSVPTSLRATGSTYTTISLAWNASTDNVGVTGYRVTRNGTTLATVSGTTLSYNDSGLTVGTSYNYTVVALDAAGNASTAATLTTATPTQVPGDIDGDAHVTLTDLTALVANWKSTTNTACDFNRDGICNALDLSILLSHYGT